MTKTRFAGIANILIALVFIYLYHVSGSPDRIAYLFGAVMFVVNGAADRIIAHVKADRQVIPDAAVYAAAFAVYGSGFDGSPAKDAWLRDFRIALEAAAPMLVTDARDAGFTACAHQFVKQSQEPAHPITRTNPHRRGEVGEWQT
jgi:hypothetical protein